MWIPTKLFTHTSLRFVFLLQKSEDLLLSQFAKPKQKRHRCRNPNKIDINTLTGEERVPVVNRRNGRKVTSSFQNIDSACCVKYVILEKVAFFSWLWTCWVCVFLHQLIFQENIISSCSSDGGGHGSTNERSSQMVAGESRVFYCPWLDRDCQTVG